MMNMGNNHISGVSPGVAGHVNRLYLYDRMAVNAAPEVRERLAAHPNIFNASAPSRDEYYREVSNFFSPKKHHEKEG